jgi:putative ABC transport system ATP-binding protein
MKIEAAQISRRDAVSGQPLLSDIGLTIQGGDRLAIRGPSGSGKTLLLRALALLDPLAAGSVRFDGSLVQGEHVPAYRAKVIYLSQQAAVIEDRVEDALRHPFLFKAHAGKTFSRERAIDWLARLERNAAFLDKKSQDLSGGEKQIVALLRVLGLNPAVLLLDEPTAALDAAATAALEKLLDNWLAENRDQRAILWVSHDGVQTARVADRIVKIAAGHLETGNTDS